jgi:hypothetical protein
VHAADILSENPAWSALTNLVLPLSPFFILDQDTELLDARIYRLQVGP